MGAISKVSRGQSGCGLGRGMRKASVVMTGGLCRVYDLVFDDRLSDYNVCVFDWSNDTSPVHVRCSCSIPGNTRLQCKLSCAYKFALVCTPCDDSRKMIAICENKSLLAAPW